MTFNTRCAWLVCLLALIGLLLYQPTQAGNQSPLPTPTVASPLPTPTYVSLLPTPDDWPHPTGTPYPTAITLQAFTARTQRR